VNLYINSPIRLHGVVLNWLSTGTTLPFTLPYRLHTVRSRTLRWTERAVRITEIMNE
jgi:hypothetical protein